MSNVKCKIIIRQREPQSQSLSRGSVGMRLSLDQGCIIIIIIIIIIVIVIITRSYAALRAVDP